VFLLLLQTGSLTCGERISSGSSGIITSPGYPNNYRNNQECLWVITVAAGQTIRIVIHHLSMISCVGDFLEVCMEYLNQSLSQGNM